MISYSNARALWIKPFSLYSSSCLRENAKVPENFLHTHNLQAVFDDLGFNPQETRAIIWGYGTILVLPFILTQMGYSVSGVEEHDMHAKLEDLFAKEGALVRFPWMWQFRRISHLEPDQPIHDVAFIINPNPAIWKDDSGLDVQMHEWLRWIKPGGLAVLQIDGDYSDPEAIASRIFQKIKESQEVRILGIQDYPETEGPFPSFYKNYTGKGNAVIVLEKASS